MVSQRRSAPQLAGYTYTSLLGTGGYAQVFRYQQHLPRRPVAVKVLEEPLSADEDRSMFEAEANAMGLLSDHPSVVTIYAASLATDGRPYLAMEFCPGSLRSASKGAPLTLDRVLEAGVRIAGALESAHRAGMLHRDIKPANVLIGKSGRPLLTDFGIASLRGRMRGDRTELAMSPQWAAPEVLQQQTSGTVASEVWSLGATLYGIAAGRPPFASPDRELNTGTKLIERITEAQYVPIPGAQGYEAFDAVVSQALQRRPEDRFGSMWEFGEALRQLQRQYGFDVTPIDVIDLGSSLHETAPSVQGLQPAPVRASARAQRRAEHLAEQAGTETVRRAPRRISRPSAAILGGVVGAAAVAAIGAILLGTGVL